MTVIVIMLILTTLTIPVIDKIRSRTEKIRCTANLKGLHTAAAAYLQEHGQWPQIDPALLNTPAHDEGWLAALSKFGIAHKNWICPTIQRLLGEPDYTEADTLRIDYLATPFDEHSFTPYKWSTQPWFIERGDVHGNGNLLIYSNGTVQELNEIQVFGSGE